MPLFHQSRVDLAEEQPAQYHAAVPWESARALNTARLWQDSAAAGEGVLKAQRVRVLFGVLLSKQCRLLHHSFGALGLCCLEL